MSGFRTVRAVLATVVLASVGLAAGGCGGSGAAVSTSAVIHVDHPTALADQAVRVRVTGLAPHEEVTVTAQATDQSGQSWQAHALFRADAAGTVDLGTTARTPDTWSAPTPTGPCSPPRPSPPPAGAWTSAAPAPATRPPRPPAGPRS